MRYTGAICDGCKKAFTDDDDIVVCPECATPQHRECYEKNHACVNKQKHSGEFQWQGEVTTQASTELKEKESGDNQPLTCPSCGYENKPGSDYCVQCGQKFTFMGINLIQKQNELEKEEKLLEESKNKPHSSYPPPFEVGKGEGFERFNNAGAKANEDNSQPDSQQNIQPPESQPPLLGNIPFDESNCFYPADMKISGNDVKKTAMAIGAKSNRYVSSFFSLENGQKVSWNWAAFFLSPFWFFYRKMYKPGIIFMTIDICLGLLGVVPSMNLSSYMQTMVSTDFSSLSDAAYEEILGNLYSLYTPILLVFAGMILLRIVCALVANPIYKRYISSVVKKTDGMTQEESFYEIFYRQGGTSLIFGILSFLLEYLLINLVGSFIL